MTLSPLFVLAAVAGVLAVWSVVDVVRHRRLTHGSRARLTVIVIFLLVIAWVQQHSPPPHDFR